MRSLMTSLFAIFTASTAACMDAPDTDPMEDPQPDGVEIQVATGEARVIRASSQEVSFSVKNGAGDVTVIVEGLPAGVTTAPITIPDGNGAGKIVLVAGEDIPQGTRATVSVRAIDADGTSASTPLALHFTDQPGALGFAENDANARLMLARPWL